MKTQPRKKNYAKGAARELAVLGISFIILLMIAGWMYVEYRVEPEADDTMYRSNPYSDKEIRELLRYASSTPPITEAERKLFIEGNSTGTTTQFTQEEIQALIRASANVE